MPLFEFECEKCKEVFEVLTSYDSTDTYPSVVCPKCSSSEKRRLVSQVAFKFGNPVGTDLWRKSHDYRYYSTALPKAKKEREMAEKIAKENGGLIGNNPYVNIDDINKGDNFGEVK